MTEYVVITRKDNFVAERYRLVTKLFTFAKKHRITGLGKEE